MLLKTNRPTFVELNKDQSEQFFQSTKPFQEQEAMALPDEYTPPQQIKNKKENLNIKPIERVKEMNFDQLPLDQPDPVYKQPQPSKLTQSDVKSEKLSPKKINLNETRLSPTKQAHFQEKNKITLKNGCYYIGDVFSGKMHGKGKLYKWNGDLIYDGQWQFGQFYGFGKLYNQKREEDWLFYEGEFVKDQIMGLGTITYKDGDRFDGQFQLNNAYGIGTYYGNKKGKIIKGFWENGRYQH